MIKLKARQLRSTSPTKSHLRSLVKNDVYIIVDNVLDTYNVGSIFRLADAVSAKKIFLCGQTEIPPNTRIKKASINTTEWVDWEYKDSAVSAIKHLKSHEKDISIVAIEQDATSVPYTRFHFKFPLALVVGHETSGVSSDVLNSCDAVVELPMWGVNVSLNVMVSLGIVLYKVMEYGNNR